MVEEAVKSYRVAYERDESGWWVATVRGVRGCHTQGRTVDEAPHPRGAGAASIDPIAALATDYPYHFRNKPSSSRNRDQAGSSSSIK